MHCFLEQKQMGYATLHFINFSLSGNTIYFSFLIFTLFCRYKSFEHLLGKSHEKQTELVIHGGCRIVLNRHAQKGMAVGMKIMFSHFHDNMPYCCAVQTEGLFCNDAYKCILK